MTGTTEHLPPAKVNVRLSDEERSLLAKLIAKEERTASDVLRRSLRDYAKRQGVSNGGSHRPKRST
jgi:predicted transcriptional regulator